MGKRQYSEADEARALSLAKRVARSINGITGVDFGFVYKKGLRQRKRGIRFHVRAKMPSAAVARKDLLPKNILGVPCDVVEARYDLHSTNPRSAFNTLVPGISVGNSMRHTGGTLGLIVQDAASGDPCLLSNWHVLAGTNCNVGEPISQPSPRDSGSVAARKIAELLRWTDLTTGYDAAIATFVPGVDLQDDVLGFERPLVGVSAPIVGMRLMKSGAVSGTTHALIDGIGAYQMDYGIYGDTVRWMDGIRLVVDPHAAEDEISLNGDSGAVWFDPTTNHAIALHFAGEDNLGPLAEYALAHDIARVLQLVNGSFPRNRPN